MRGAPSHICKSPRRFGIIPADAGSTEDGSDVLGVNRDHPRGCGEHRLTTHVSIRPLGSSPRMRGAQYFPSLSGFAARIIPADAGSTHVSGSVTSRERDHPRGCGEHSGLSLDPRTLQGSSPRMRGARTTKAPTRLRQDHPRGCGEHKMDCKAACRVRGSSPRMRGAQTGKTTVADTGRIIPADAGSTNALMPSSNDGPDHPRGCGEHSGGVTWVPAYCGSSPRMRGAPGADHGQCGGHGIIPADAGSTVLGSPARNGIGDHPRGCGEHLRFCMNTACSGGSSPRMRGDAYGVKPLIYMQGSSPRMRGAPYLVSATLMMMRIIPADAGSTSQRRQGRYRTQDHPRGCGEHPGCPLSTR